MRLDAPITAIKGIGEVKSADFAKRGILTVGDLLEFFPRGYEYRGDVVPLRDCTDGEVHAVVVRCTKNPVVGRTRSGLEFFRMYAEDDSASLTVTFFGRRFLMDQIRAGRSYRLYGRITMGLCGAEATSPEIEPITAGKPLPDIIPVYPLSGGLTQKAVRGAVEQCLSLCAGFAEILPQEIRQAHGLMPRSEMFRQMHRPESKEQLAVAKRTAAFTELLVFQTALRCMRKAKDGAHADALLETDRDSFLQQLPFPLTGAQTRAIEEIKADLAKDVPMTRLVQGDVGSGKTVVAAAALELCAQNGKQAVMLAPTEILAAQHAEKLSKWFEPLGIRCALLTGGLTKKQKNEIKKALLAGEIDVLIGTHAVLQDDVEFAGLGLVVTDEQHRFGVRQRALLLDKSEQAGGKRAHMLVMSATPIPRSLSLILYGDLDVTLLDELPPGRQTIDTLVLTPKDRNGIYGSIKRQLSMGGQAYIICPLVEENAEAEEKSPKKAAETYFAELQNGPFADIPMGLIHGKLTPSQKAGAMDAFASGQTKILVSTTVIEVGVDVPNANVMLIENAECFGLSQLHQLRGRIGRGQRKSYCVLLNGSGKENERLAIMKETCDGFRIAEADLEQRGPGDFFGERQSGEMVLRTASLTDMPLIKETSRALEGILPHLRTEAYKQLFAEAVRVVRRAGSGKTIN